LKAIFCSIIKAVNEIHGEMVHLRITKTEESTETVPDLYVLANQLHPGDDGNE